MPSSSGPGFNTAAVVATTAAATAALLALLRLALYPRHPQILKGPLTTVIPKLTPAELAALDYRPDAFPGARDVDTPYGSIRVYEWGPATGPKVLLIHGISTSCQTLGPIAHALARRGSRVLLFDLFGRGFSDAPADLPHDARLYVSQALMALASSPVPGWDTRIRVVGYSMGGGIAVHLAGCFPHLVESLALLAPAGLIRADRFGVLPNLVFRSGLVPDRVLAALTRRRLRRPIASGVKGKGKTGGQDGSSGGKVAVRGQEEQQEPLLEGRRRSEGGHHAQDGLGAALAEAADDDDDAAAPLRPASPLEARVLRYVQWMVAHHAGFVRAFTASLRDAPLTGQEAAYARLGRAEGGVRTALVFGRADTVVDEKGYREDALPLLGGEDRVLWRVVGGGHDFPMTHAAEAVRVLEEFWGLEGGDGVE